MGVTAATAAPEKERASEQKWPVYMCRVGYSKATASIWAEYYTIRTQCEPSNSITAEADHCSV